MNFHLKIFSNGFANIYLISDQIRGKAKKTAGNTKNNPKHPAPKHRGWKFLDGSVVSKGTILVLQRTPRFFPGLNVSVFDYAQQYGQS